LGCAGTADFSSPLSKPIFHIKNDVDPYNLILELKKRGINIEDFLIKYYEVRPHIYIDEETGKRTINKFVRGES
jgi:hypothetical protein